MNRCEFFREKYAQDWERMVGHPFVHSLGNGSLPREAFASYMRQDYLFIDTLVRLVSSAIARAPSVETAKPLGSFLNTLLGAEDALFNNVFTRMNLSRPDRDSDMKTITLRFTNYLLGLGRRGSFEPIATALFVTEGTYSDWAKRLAADNKRPGDPLYAEWINIHAESSLADFVSYLANQSGEIGNANDARVERVFRRTLRYEIAFWDEFFGSPATECPHA